MTNDEAPLTSEERAELEALRAEKARRERAELEQLRAERGSEGAASPTRPRRETETPRREATAPQRETEAQRRARRLMEPGEDLSMPVAQKIILVVLALVVAAVIAVYLFVSR